MRIFIGEGDKFDSRPLHEAWWDSLKRKGFTAQRCCAGWRDGPRARRLPARTNMPAAVARSADDEEVVDTQENIDRVMPENG